MNAPQDSPASALHRCECCGYALGGLGPDARCPECGLAVALSAPREREGTAWQRGRGLGSLGRTWWGLITDDACWREMRIDRRSRRGFLFWCRVLAYAGVLLPAVSVFALATNDPRDGLGAGGVTLVIAMLGLMGAVEVVMRAHASLAGFRLGVGAPLRNENNRSAAHQQVAAMSSAAAMLATPFLAAGVLCFGAAALVGSIGVRAGLWVSVGVGGGGLLAGVALAEIAYRRGWRAMRYRRLRAAEIRQVDTDAIGAHSEALEEPALGSGV